MPVAIACPNCQTKYSIQDALLGRPVKCRKCGSVFNTEAPKPTNVAVPGPVQNQIAGPARAGGPTDQELAAAGLSGSIAGSQQLFEGGPFAGGDPLANHVVQDPGFRSSRTNVEEEASQEELGFKDVMNNPALNKPTKTKKKIDPLSEYLTP